MRSVCLTSETTDHKAPYQITRKDETTIAIVRVHSFTDETESGLVRTSVGLMMMPRSTCCQEGTKACVCLYLCSVIR